MLPTRHWSTQDSTVDLREPSHRAHSTRVAQRIAEGGDRRVCQGMHAMGVQLLSTGGTSTLLQAAGIPVVAVSDYRLPGDLDGRVKTLHPRIHGGILALRENPPIRPFLPPWHRADRSGRCQSISLR